MYPTPTHTPSPGPLHPLSRPSLPLYIKQQCLEAERKRQVDIHHGVICHLKGKGEEVANFTKELALQLAAMLKAQPKEGSSLTPPPDKEKRKGKDDNKEKDNDKKRNKHLDKDDL